jgi:hypothetical protein
MDSFTVVLNILVYFKPNDVHHAHTHSHSHTHTPTPRSKLTGSSPDTVTLNLAGAVLLNTRDYSFLSSHNVNFEPGKVSEAVKHSKYFGVLILLCVCGL